MIPWVTYGNFLKGLIQYNQKEDARLIYVNTVDNDIKTFKFLYKELTEGSTRARNLMHVSLNFHPDDKELLTEDYYVELVEDFLSSYGFPIDQPYLVYEHTDKNHPHVHIAVPMMKTDGLIINDSYAAKRMIKIAREIEKKYNLKEVVPGEALGVTQTQNEAVTHETAKSALEYLIPTILDERPANDEELRKASSLFSVEYNGVKSQLGFELSKRNTGITFYLKDSEGKQLSKGIKGSKLPGNLSYGRLKEKYSYNSIVTQSRKEKTREKVEEVLSGLGQNVTLSEFKKGLELLGVLTQEYYGKNGQIFGIDFTDSFSGIKFKGSQLHKSLSWNSLKTRIKKPQEDRGVVIKESSKSTIENQINENMKSTNFGVIADLKSKVSLIDLIEQHGYEYNKKKSTQTMKAFQGPDVLLVYNDSKTGDISGLRYTTANNKLDGGDILNFLINKGIVEDNKEAIKYLLKETDAPRKASKPVQESIPKFKEKKPFVPIRATPFEGENDFLIVDRGIELDIVDKNFNGAVFTTTHENLYEDLKNLYGNAVHKYLDKSIKPLTNYTVFPLYHFQSGELVGQQVKHTDFNHMVVNSDKTNGIWHNYDPTKRSIHVVENPIDAISHKELNNNTSTSYFATLGNPSSVVVSHIASLAKKHDLILAGDNDEAGQFFNSIFIFKTLSLLTGTEIKAVNNKEHFRITFSGNDFMSGRACIEQLLAKVDSVRQAKPESQVQEDSLTFTIKKDDYRKNLSDKNDTISTDQNAEMISLINENILYFYNPNIKTITTNLKDFNEDLLAKKSIGKQRNKPQL